MLAIYRKNRTIWCALQAGAKGFLIKNVDAQVLTETVRAAYRGEAFMSPILAAKLLYESHRLFQATEDASGIQQLTEGEMAVLRLMADGADKETVADQLNLSVQTVANRLQSVYQKLQAALNSRGDAGNG
jgi:DNA-binding NarL/FixJ family response regulator